MSIFIGLIFAACAYAQTLVQQTSAATCNSSGASTTSCVLPGAASSANLLVVTVGLVTSSGIAVSSIASGGTCTLVIAVVGSTLADSEIWKCINPTNTTITITTSSLTTTTVGNVSEWSGMTSTVDKTATNTGTGGTVTTGTTATTTQANELAIGTVAQFTGATRSTGPTNSYTNLNTQSSALFSAAYLILSSTGTTSTGWTYTGTNAWGATVATIKASAVAAVTPRMTLIGVGP